MLLETLALLIVVGAGSFVLAYASNWAVRAISTPRFGPFAQLLALSIILAMHFAIACQIMIGPMHVLLLRVQRGSPTAFSADLLGMLVFGVMQNASFGVIRRAEMRRKPRKTSLISLALDPLWDAGVDR